MALEIAKLPWLSSGCDVVSVSREAGCSVELVARLYFRVGQRLGFEWLRRTARAFPADRAWDKQAIASVMDDLLSTQRGLVRSMLQSRDANGDLDALIRDWGKTRGPLFARTQQLMSELRATPNPDFAMLSLANQQLKALLTGR